MAERIEFATPRDEAGVYSNIMRIWHTPFDFTLDFGVLGLGHDEHGDHVVTVPTVARVKVPTSVIFQLARAIADNVAQYEQKYGPISGGSSAPDSPGELA